ncbi:MAG: SpoIIE family protein phosphatase [Oscillospiraceae bacterium]|nr:SpoIIE family protein phosphatase [Oscillospiraceae bacterium]
MLEWIKLKEDPRIWRGAGLTGCAALSCLLTAASFNGLQIPLSTALSAALSPTCGIAVLAGSLFTYALTGELSNGPVFLCAIALTSLLRWMFGMQHTPRTAAMLAVSGTGLSAVIFSMARLIGGREMIYWAAAALLAGVFAACIRKTAERFEGGVPVRLHTGDAPAFSVCFVILTAALCSVRVLMLSLGQMFAAFVLLTAAKRYRAYGGMICGTLAAFALLITDTHTAGFAVILPAAGLTAGCLAGKHGGLLFFAVQLFSAAALMLSGWDVFTARVWVNSMIGGMLFLFLPACQIADALILWSDADADLSALTDTRMRFLSDSIAGVRESAERIADMLAKTETACSPAERVRETVCARCSYRETCWEHGDREAADCFRRLSDAGLTEQAEAPFNCLKPDLVTAEFKRAKRQNAEAKALAVRLRNIQTLLFSQMRITEELLSGDGSRFRLTYHRELTRYVSDVLGKYQISLLAAAVSETDSRRLLIELYVPADTDPDTAFAAEILGEALQKPLECCGTETAGSGKRILLQSTGGFSVTTAAAQCAAHDDEPCGDCWDTFSDRNGTVYLAVSDGMGTGKNAALDARIVLSNFRQLVQSGMNCKAAAEMINAIMLTKSGDERFATLDIAQINTDNASVTLYKYGAGPTFVRHGEHITLCQAPTDPIGIQPRTAPYSTVLQLERGDMLFLLTDGMDDSVFPVIRQKILQGGDLQSLVHTVCARAPRKADGTPADDVTVLAAVISGNTIDE